MSGSVEYAAFVGIDWADREHAVCLATADQEPPESFVVTQQADALDDWVNQLRLRFGKQPVAVCLEQSRGALLYALMKYENLVLFPINPKQLAKYRQAFAPCGPKGDPTDAKLLCEFVRQHHVRLRPWKPDDSTTRQLRLLTEDRRRWVDHRTAAGNQLLQRLKESYPLALTFCRKRVYAGPLLALLVRFPSQRELQRASPKQLHRWLPRRRQVVDDSRSPADDDRVVAIRAAAMLTTDTAVVQAGRLAVQQLAKLLQWLNETIAEYDRQIAAVFATHPDAEIFASAPGAGPVLASRLVAAFGADRSRYASAEDLQRLTGIAPITVQSGRSRQVRMRRACPKFLRQTFHEFARCSIPKSAWARAYWEMLRAKGCRFNAAVRALAYKWMRILFRCWQTRQLYDEQRYLSELRRKKSPLIAFLAPATPSA